MNAGEYVTIDEVYCCDEDHNTTAPEKKRAREDDHHSQKAVKKETSDGIRVSFGSKSMCRRYGERLCRLFERELLCDWTRLRVRWMDATTLCFDEQPDREPDRQPDREPEGDNGNVSEDNTDEVLVLDNAPLYSVSFRGVVGASEVDSSASKSTRGRGLCFNCGGEHLLADCDQPRDAARIAANRRRRLAEAPASVGGGGRYHQEAEQMFSGVRAGSISDALRHALGLRHSQLPAHIYRMRRLGYPPGWLRAAEVRVSQISVLTDARQRRKRQRSQSPTYDASQLIAFAGFNEPVPWKAEDEHRRMCALPYDDSQSLRRMRQRLAAVRDAASTLLCPAATAARSHLKAAEDGGGESLAQDVIQLDDNDDNDDAMDNGGGSCSAGQHQQLEVIDVEDDEAAANGREVVEVEEGEINETTPPPPSCSTGQFPLSSVKDDVSEPEPEPLVRVPAGERPLAQSTPCLRRTLAVNGEPSGTSLRVDLGTPVAAISSSHVSLPDVDKWSTGITQHLAYENLPGATGAWKRMRSLVMKVRSRVKAIAGDH